MKLPDGVSSLVYRDDDGREIVRKLQPDWIPVSERLPEIGQDVLCTLKVDDVNRRVAVCKCKQEVWWYYAIAWMPLPEPYREDGESE